MYLHARKYVEKINWDMLRQDNDLSMDSVEVVNPLWKDIVNTAEMSDVAHDIYGVNVEVTCAYWRKANQIHAWFVDNVQAGEDDCGDYYVSHEKLKELLDLVNEALRKRDPNLIKPRGGFFFGNTDIDEYYWHYIKETEALIGALLKKADEKWEFYYRSSW